MHGWIIPPPCEPTKSRAELRQERTGKVRWLVQEGYIISPRIKDALLKVAREDFIPPYYRDYAYLEVPLPLPGANATISCPHSYPLFYEPLALDKGHKFLEIGLGSGYGAAVAREIVGPEGLVVSIDIDQLTMEFARDNLEKAGYRDIVLVNRDGGRGCPELAPFDRISVTAACREIPPPLLDQLRCAGRLIAPVQQDDVQKLVLVEKEAKGFVRHEICDVLYVALQGQYGP